jgi:tetratricopeptide (TPR) repeat protein
MFVLILFVSFLNSPLLQRGDQFFMKQEYYTAIAAYEEHLQQNPDDPEALWRIARAYISIGDVAPRDEREPFSRKAEVFASRAVRSDSLNSNAHTWRAVALGYIALYEGSRTKVRLCNEIKNELDLAIRLDPKNDVAYSIYGTFYRTLGKVTWYERSLANLLLGGLPDGGFEEAEAALKKAIALAPNLIRHQFELGMVYIEMDRPDDARRIFTGALKLPVLLASDVQRIERMKRRLSQMNTAP